MSKLLKYVSEYFLGTETIKFYRDERNFYREYVTDPSFFKKLIRLSKFYEITDLAGRYAPNFIDTLSVLHFFITKKPPYMLLVGEGVRLSCIAISNSIKKRLMLGRKHIKLLWKTVQRNSGITNLEDLADDIEDGGEEWKMPKI